MNLGWKLAVLWYYLFISRLPHSRFLGLFNVLRVYYLSKILKVMPFDRNSKFEFNVYISNGNKLKIGNYCRINENVFLQGDIRIGDYVMIAPNVAIYTSNHFYKDIDKPMVTYGNALNSPVVIEDNVWIGRNVVVLPGVTIATGSIVGANSVVTKNVPANSVVGGVPAKFIKYRE